MEPSESVEADALKLTARDAGTEAGEAVKLATGAWFPVCPPSVHKLLER